MQRITPRKVDLHPICIYSFWNYSFFIIITSTDDNGMSVTSGATAPAPPNRLMLKT
jgi:hypothetical protein